MRGPWDGNRRSGLTAKEAEARVFAGKNESVGAVPLLGIEGDAYGPGSAPSAEYVLPPLANGISGLVVTFASYSIHATCAVLVDIRPLPARPTSPAVRMYPDSRARSLVTPKILGFLAQHYSDSSYSSCASASPFSTEDTLCIGLHDAVVCWYRLTRTFVLTPILLLTPNTPNPRYTLLSDLKTRTRGVAPAGIHITRDAEHVIDADGADAPDVDTRNECRGAATMVWSSTATTPKAQQQAKNTGGADMKTFNGSKMLHVAPGGVNHVGVSRVMGLRRLHRTTKPPPPRKRGWSCFIARLLLSVASSILSAFFVVGSSTTLPGNIYVMLNINMRWKVGKKLKSDESGIFSGRYVHIQPPERCAAQRKRQLFESGRERIPFISRN
ncbi:hypothetical protein D9619_011991 [Psilocybe cf. subviscida]|uniref:Uncharacterized protein n=1 Tax=Psilocybe cf. subviscida TaxID=2480587 RepID=A0A8H5B1P7_9AGAR|nr:hypothetical protein D9619_011991 [Psilocybe cf. subviscida]